MLLAELFEALKKNRVKPKKRVRNRRHVATVKKPEIKKKTKKKITKPDWFLIVDVLQ